MVKVIADEFLTDDRDRKYYADNYSCCPPPLFIIFITLVEVSLIFNLIRPQSHRGDFMGPPSPPGGTCSDWSVRRFGSEITTSPTGGT